MGSDRLQSLHDRGAVAHVEPGGQDAAGAQRVAQPQLDGVEPEAFRKLVHQGLEGEG